MGLFGIVAADVTRWPIGTSWRRRVVLRVVVELVVVRILWWIWVGCRLLLLWYRGGRRVVRLRARGAYTSALARQASVGARRGRGDRRDFGVIGRGGVLLLKLLQLRLVLLS